jgi:hypothetical protein
MSMDKAIRHGKEKRRPYHGSKVFDRSCRDNTCPFCLGSKLHQQRKAEASAQSQLSEQETEREMK